MLFGFVWLVLVQVLLAMLFGFAVNEWFCWPCCLGLSG